MIDAADIEDEPADQLDDRAAVAIAAAALAPLATGVQVPATNVYIARDGQSRLYNGHIRVVAIGGAGILVADRAVVQDASRLRRRRRSA